MLSGGAEGCTALPHPGAGCSAPAPGGPTGSVSVPRHAEDEAGAVFGEVWLGLVELCLHRNSALLPMQSALHGVGDVDLKVALLAGRTKKTGS